uniref:Uncharacterized protein n=1 Tax=Lygus hesperus TaxID=30085 RepID=A0A0A9YLM4_LYGHE
MASSAKPLIEKLKEQFSGASYHDYQKNMAKRRVLDELSKLILNQPVESDNESSSNLFKILVKRFKVQLGATEKDPMACDIAARKLAKFVEMVMKEAYFAQRHKRRTTNIRSFSALPVKKDSGNRVRSVDSRLKRTNSKSGLEKDSIIKGLGFANSKTSSPVVIEKVPRSFARNVPKCGPLYSAKIGGRKVYVQEVKEGESKKALISRVNSESTDPNREWSSWMVDLANKTKEWIKWLDEKASLVDNKKRDSGSRSSSVRSSTTSSTWATLEDNSTSRSAGNERGKRDHEVARLYQNMWRESSSDSTVTENSPRPSTTSTNVHRAHTSSGSSRSESHNYRSREAEINDFYFTSKPTTSKHNYTFASSRRRTSPPPAM